MKLSNLQKNFYILFSVFISILIVTLIWENINLPEQNVELYKNESKIISGYGSDVLGSPLNVLEWSINHLSKRGKHINPGDIISTGTCTGIIPIFPGDNIVANFVGLDTIKLNISN